MKKLRVAVLFGGRSGEHDVSLMSARSVLAALDPERYEVIQIGITLDGNWLTGANTLGRIREEGFFQIWFQSFLQPNLHLVNPCMLCASTKTGDKLETLAECGCVLPRPAWSLW